MEAGEAIAVSGFSPAGGITLTAGEAVTAAKTTGAGGSTSSNARKRELEHAHNGTCKKQKVSKMVQLSFPQADHL